MKARKPILICSLLLSACTAEFNLAPESNAKVSDSFRPLFSLQHKSSAPKGSYKDIDRSQLLPGDLLFSSTVGLTSAGIRLFSVASVSHVAIYLGDNRVAEAIGSGVQIVTLTDVISHSDKLFVLRNQNLSDEQAVRLREFATLKQGVGYNFKGIIKMVPFMVTSKLCSLNPFSREFRQQCVQGLARSQLGYDKPSDNERYFCSQFVVAAYQYAGQPLTLAEASWISPTDLLHMREGDIATVAPVQQLQYIGHLRPGIYFKALRVAKN